MPNKTVQHSSADQVPHPGNGIPCKAVNAHTRANATVERIINIAKGDEIMPLERHNVLARAKSIRLMSSAPADQ